MTIRKVLISMLSCICLTIAAPAMAGDVYVIANNAITLSADEVRDVFLGDKQIAGSAKLIQLDNASLQKDFLDKVLKMEATK